MAQIGIFFRSKTEMTTNAGDIIKNEMESYCHLTDMFGFKMRGFGPKPNDKIMRYVKKW